MARAIRTRLLRPSPRLGLMLLPSLRRYVARPKFCQESHPRTKQRQCAWASESKIVDRHERLYCENHVSMFVFEKYKMEAAKGENALALSACTCIYILQDSKQGFRYS